MANVQIELKGKIEALKGDEERWLIGATIREHFSRLTDMTVEFVTKGPIKLKDLVGQEMSVKLITKEAGDRYFNGICISVECIGQKKTETGVHFHYVAKVRHWLWMLTRTSDNRIFQEMTAVQIIEQIFADHGFVDYTKKLSASYETRVYCVQYRETDFDFISRLMEEEGIYYYFDNSANSGTKNKMILADDASGSHSDIPGLANLKYTGTGGRSFQVENTLTDWASAEAVISGKVTLNDFDMLTPKADLKVVKQTGTSSSHSHKSYELYHYPGHYRKDTGRGQRLSKVRMEAEEIAFQVKRGVTTAREVANGFKFTLEEAPEGDNGKYLITEAVHYFRPSSSQRIDPGRQDRDREDLTYPEEMDKMDYCCYFGCIPEAIQYRAPLETTWPEIAGLHTAIVVGPSGEEIYTDEHGRIKVQFHWDREGSNDENSSCWVRVATPWSGKGWGMVAIPRIGQEVVIQFEEGNPDRPICTGMLWNEDTKPAFKYPDNATELGIRTNSSKGGNADQEYNELMFDDKMGEEKMRVQAQKDHQFLIKNKSVLTIGLDEVDAGAHDEDGSLSEVIRNHVTRTIQEGSHYLTIQQGDEEFKIETGSQTIEIETDKTQTIQQNYSTTIAQGDHTTEVSMGNFTNEVSQGNHETTVSMGNLTVDVSMGKITMEAMQSIELKVGANSIKIDQTGVTVKGTMIKVQGTAMAEVKSPMTTVKGDGMLTLKGGITMIN